MAAETLEQWAARQMAQRVSIQNPRPQLNRRSLLEAEEARRREQAAVLAHQQRMAQRDVQRAASPPPSVATAGSPSLGGGLMRRVVGMLTPSSTSEPAPAPNVRPRARPR